MPGQEGVETGARGGPGQSSLRSLVVGRATTGRCTAGRCESYPEPMMRLTEGVPSEKIPRNLPFVGEAPRRKEQVCTIRTATAPCPGHPGCE
jgi:hypothetical protein